MSDDQLDAPSETQQESASLMRRLEIVHAQYQQRHVYSRLDDIADTMERTLLQITIAEHLFGASISVDEAAQETVESIREQLQASPEEGTDELVDEDELSELEETVEAEENRVSNRIQEVRVQRASTVKAMQRLNEEVALVDTARLQALVTLLDTWEWQSQVYTADATTFEERKAAAESFAKDMREVLDDTKEKIGAEFAGSDIESLVDTLLQGDKLSLTGLTESEREALAESKLGGHLTVTLA